MLLHTRLRCLLISLLAISLLSCAERPKTAPEDFQELTSFLYEHLMDEDDEELSLGVENLYVWLNQNTKAVRKGYTVKNLSAEAIATTTRTSNPKDLIGGAVLTAHQHTVDSLARAFGIDNVRETNGDSYTKYDRTFVGDPECFDRKECKILEGDSQSTSEWYGLVELSYDTHLQFRWVNTKYGYVMLQRSYMNKKPTINLDIIEPKEGYYLAIVLPPMTSKEDIDDTTNLEDSASTEEPVNTTDEVNPMNEAETSSEMSNEFVATELNLEIDEAVTPREGWGKSSLVQVNWLDVDYGLLPVTEDRALEMLVGSLIDVAVSTEKWMDKTYIDAE